MKRLSLALTAAVLSQMALAIENPYIGLDYQRGDFSINGQKSQPEAFRISGGSELNPYLAVVAQAGFKTQSATLTLPGPVHLDTSVDSFYALFLRPQISIGDISSVYGLVGASYIGASANSDNTGIQPNTTGYKHQLSYGAGVDLKVYKKIRLNADYIKYSDNYSAVSAGVRISFY